MLLQLQSLMRSASSVCFLQPFVLELSSQDGLCRWYFSPFYREFSTVYLSFSHNPYTLKGNLHVFRNFSSDFCQSQPKSKRSWEIQIVYSGTHMPESLHTDEFYYVPRYTLFCIAAHIIFLCLCCGLCRGTQCFLVPIFLLFMSRHTLICVATHINKSLSFILFSMSRNKSSALKIWNL